MTKEQLLYAAIGALVSVRAMHLLSFLNGRPSLRPWTEAERWALAIAIWPVLLVLLIAAGAVRRGSRS